MKTTLALLFALALSGCSSADDAPPLCPVPVSASQCGDGRTAICWLEDGSAFAPAGCAVEFCPDGGRERGCSGAAVLECVQECGK